MLEILDPELYKRFGEVKVASASELSDLTGRGWQLICLLQEKQASTEQREIKCPGPNPGGGNNCCAHGSYNQCYSSDWVTVPFETDVTSFVLGRDKDSTLADLGRTVEELREELADVQSDAVRIEMERSATHDRRVKSDDQNAILRREQKALQEEIEDQAQRITTHLGTINKMETDIGKLRDEFGNQAVTRVLG